MNWGTATYSSTQPLSLCKWYHAPPFPESGGKGANIWLNVIVTNISFQCFVHRYNSIVHIYIKLKDNQQVSRATMNFLTISTNIVHQQWLYSCALTSNWGTTNKCQGPWWSFWLSLKHSLYSYHRWMSCLRMNIFLHQLALAAYRHYLKALQLFFNNQLHSSLHYNLTVTHTVLTCQSIKAQHNTYTHNFGLKSSPELCCKTAQ